MVDSDSHIRLGGPAETAGPPVVPQELSRVALVGSAVVVLTEVLRAVGPPFGHLAATTGGATASGLIVLACLAGLLAPAVRALAGPRGLVVGGIGGLLLARLALQVFAPVTWTAFAGAIFAMLAIPALYEAARGLSGTGFAVAAIGGLTCDTAIRLAFGTWGPPARTGVAAWAVTVVVMGAVTVALWRWLAAAPLEAPVIGWRDALGAAALGPFLALQVLVLADPAFAASSGGLPPEVAGAVVIIGQALALAFLSSGLAVAAVPGGVCVFGGTVLGVGAAAATGRYGLTGLFVIAVVVCGQVLAAWLLAVACRVPLRRGGYRGRPARRGGPPPDVAVADTGGQAWRLDVGAAAGGLLIVAVLLPYQAHYQAPLPLPNKVLPGAAGIVLGLLSAITAARGGPLPARSAIRALGAGVGALVLLAVPAIHALTAPAIARTGALPGTFRLVSYDIGQAVDDRGHLDPETVAREIEGEHADVVALQEVGRGWPTSGTADVGAWLARRLKMRLVWGPAADNQFGNAILTRLPVRATGTGRLPVGAGPQAPGYVWARVDAGGGRTAEVWSFALQQGTDRTQTRRAEFGRLLQVWSGAPRTVIAGDAGAAAAGRDLARLSSADGLRGATGAIAPATPAGTRTGWVLGSDDVGFDSTSVGRSGPAAGRAPLAVTVRIVG